MRIIILILALFIMSETIAQQPSARRKLLKRDYCEDNLTLGTTTDPPSGPIECEGASFSTGWLYSEWSGWYRATDVRINDTTKWARLQWLYSDTTFPIVYESYNEDDYYYVITMENANYDRIDTLSDYYWSDGNFSDGNWFDLGYVNHEEHDGYYIFRFQSDTLCRWYYSGIMHLTVPVTPDPGINPTSQTKNTGEAATISVDCETTITTYQWQVYSGGWNNITGGGVYTGFTGATLSISDVTGLNGKQYRCVCSNNGCPSGGSNTPTSTLTVI